MSPTTDHRLILFRSVAAGLVALLAFVWILPLDPQETYARPANVYSAEDPAGQAMPHDLVPDPQGIDEIVWDIPDDQIKHLDGVPIALQLSGPFSADITFNGILIGSKGVPGRDAETETAGPIDAKFSIPVSTLRVTNNQVVIRYSANHLNYRPSSVIQDMRIVAFSADERRPLRYYGVTILSIGAVLSLAFGLWRLGSGVSERSVYLLVFGCGGLILAAMAEVSRSFVNYPYPWHAPRQALAGIGIVVFCAALAIYTAIRWPIHRHLRRATGAAIIAICIAGLVTRGGFDGRTAIAAFLILALSALWLIAAGFRADRKAWLFAILPIALASSSAFTPVLFIDHQVFVISALGLGYFLIAWPGLLVPKSEPDTTTEAVNTRFPVKDAGNTSFIEVKEILRLRAAGNYSEVHMINGQRFFDQRGIGAILKDLPDCFFRLHKSHVVNLRCIETLKAKQGSRYSVILASGDELPVGRSRLKDLKSALERET